MPGGRSLEDIALLLLKYKTQGQKEYLILTKYSHFPLPKSYIKVNSKKGNPQSRSTLQARPNLERIANLRP
jgi:hypothetical protein